MDALLPKAETPKELGDRSRLLIDKHVNFIVDFANRDNSFEHVATEHIKISGVYWALAALHILKAESKLDTEQLMQWVLSCQKKDGGFGASPRNDSHLLFTLSAIQILALLRRLDVLDIDKVVLYVSALQNTDGSFCGDAYGEVDTRFSYCAISACTLLQRPGAIDMDKAVEYVLECRNTDGGFGVTPGTESHAGQVFCCIGALSIAGALERLRRPELTAWWLCERQTPSGGLNGRPEKLQDVCYTWWCLSSLHILKNELHWGSRLHWIDREALERFILYSQDEDRGGISDRPDDACDVYHTFFGVAGLSLMGHGEIADIDASYALPVEILKDTLLRQT